MLAGGEGARDQRGVLGVGRADADEIDIRIGEHGCRVGRLVRGGDALRLRRLTITGPADLRLAIQSDRSGVNRTDHSATDDGDLQHGRQAYGRKMPVLAANDHLYAVSDHSARYVQALVIRKYL